VIVCWTLCAECGRGHLLQRVGGLVAVDCAVAGFGQDIESDVALRLRR
jgi:hypothetical protein